MSSWKVSLVVPMRWIGSDLGSAFMIYSTNRMPQDGGQRTEVKGSVKHKGGRKYEPIKEIL